MLLDWQDFKLECTFSGLNQNHNARRMWQLQSIERILLKGNILKYSDIYQQKAHTLQLSNLSKSKSRLFKV